MPEPVQCPNCQQKLRVPDNLLGKKVKCPKCATVFEAKAKPAPAPAAPVDEEDDGGSYVFKPEPPPEPKKKIRLSEDDDEDDEDDEDEEGRAKKKKKKRRHNAEALKKVAGPATGLQVTAVLAMLMVVFSAVVNFVPSVRDRLIPAPPGAQAGQVEIPTSVKVGQGIGTLISFLIQIAILSSASKMKQLESYRSALITSIIAFLPCTCCIVGLPVGIWSLVVIHSPEVRPFFKA
jgi:predicted Zn finger-like uncharacterized protein